jgi:hypothetical protein
VLSDHGNQRTHGFPHTPHPSSSLQPGCEASMLAGTTARP